MEGHAKKCVERYCELGNKTTQQLYKVSTPCLDDHDFKEEELKIRGENCQKCALRERELFLSVHVDDIEMAGKKKQNLDPMCKILMKEVDLGEPTSFFDHVYLGCTQREGKTSKDIVDNYRDLFESRMSAGGVDKLLHSEKSEAHISSWSF